MNKPKSKRVALPRHVYLEAHYFGDKSRDFWNIVNSLPNPHREAAYALGVALQNFEAQMLKHLHDYGGPGLVAPLYWWSSK